MKSALKKIVILVMFAAIASLLSAIVRQEAKEQTGTGLIEKERVISTEKITDDLFGPYEVIRVVDGDTIVVDIEGKESTVRMIGVDTPESVHSDESKNSEEGKEASEYTKSRLEGENIVLEYDVSQTDKYGRILAYVYCEGKMYNLELIETGMARTMTIPPDVKYESLFATAQEEARQNNKGFWNSEIWN